MATTKKGDTPKARKPAAEKTTVDAPKRATRNTAAAAAKADGASKTSPAKPAAKKAAPVKLTDNQVKFLQAIAAAGEAGYEPRNKNEQRSIDALVTRKLLKKGAKNKETGNARYLLTKAGTSHLPTA
ncbi:hypothetical protein [Tautonia plasticadhaerens]|uniref:Uncharacterized protein n=1 Tax=Tautonia plasticadhaerens TaxID=2527974 RepID=A0A518GZD8_9BACT|nr:hypothetical protein [Tautonia plasticadhaerens]QDV33933.1 hypothetical protein ElP_18140 [Tautonia plasticadhaerens]